MDPGKEHLRVLMSTFVGPYQPILPDPAPDWDYAKALKSAYANFPAHCKAMQSRGGLSSEVGAAFEWLKKRNGGLRYFAIKGGFSGGSSQGALVKQLRRENKSLRKELEEARGQSVVRRPWWRLHLMYSPLVILYLLSNWRG